MAELNKYFNYLSYLYSILYEHQVVKVIQMTKLTILLLAISGWVMLTGFLTPMVPNFALHSYENKLIHLDDIRGEKLTIIDICSRKYPSSVGSMSHFSALHDKYEDSGVQFVSVCIDHPRMTRYKSIIKEHNIQYPVLVDTRNHLGKELNIKKYPTILVIDHENKILHRYEGYRLGIERTIEKQIMNYLK
jgi:peroxiredoxin